MVMDLALLCFFCNFSLYFLASGFLLGYWFKYNFALQKKKSYPLLANADTVSNRN